MKKVSFIFDEVFLTHDMPRLHPESKERLVAVVEKLKQSGHWQQLIHISPQKASLSDLEMVHSPDYIEKIQNFGVGYLDPDTYMSQNTFNAALFASGAVKTAIESCRSKDASRAFCAVRPPGHHAENSRAMGFCIFNNVAVGARYAQKKGFPRVLIADFDVHHGNGTERIFYEDDTVFYFSTHQFPHYPGTGNASDIGMGRGEGYTCNLPLPYGAGDLEMRKAYHVKLHEIVTSFNPDLILVSAGYDIHQRDPLAGFSVTDSGVGMIVRGILDAKKEIPVIFVLEGGYDLESLASSVSVTLREMSQ